MDIAASNIICGVTDAKLFFSGRVLFLAALSFLVTQLCNSPLSVSFILFFFFFVRSAFRSLWSLVSVHVHYLCFFGGG